MRRFNFFAALSVGFSFLAFAGCDTRTFVGESSRTTNPYAPMSADSVDDDVEVGVEYETASEDELSLVDNALAAFRANLIGGPTCWGSQASPWTGTPESIIKVRKNATGCALVFTELSFKDPLDLVVRSNVGLSTTEAGYKGFSNDAKTKTLSVRVRESFKVTADSTVILAGMLSNVLTTDTVTTNDEIKISAKGDVVAYPHVKISGAPALFLGKMDFTLECVEVAAVGSCRPSVKPQAGGVAAPQSLAKMEAAILVLDNAHSQKYPGSVTNEVLRSVWTTPNRLDVAKSGAPLLAAGRATFKEITLPPATASQIVLFVVQYSEPLHGKNEFAYKVFKLKIGSR